MRDYLKLYEIREVLSDTDLDDKEIQKLMIKMSQEAQRCLCAARSEYECTCGAWDYEGE
jgi:hypothetical protein